MPTSLDEWTDSHWERVFSRQSAQADAAKLVTTFTAAIASTLVATALQVGERSNRLDFWACIVLGAAFLATLGVIYLDRLYWPSRYKILAKKDSNLGWSDNQLMAYIKDVSTEAEENNEAVVGRIKKLAELQILLSLAAAVLAAVSLLR